MKNLSVELIFVGSRGYICWIWTDVEMAESVEFWKWDFMGQTVTETVQFITGLLLSKIIYFWHCTKLWQVFGSSASLLMMCWHIRSIKNRVWSEDLMRRQISGPKEQMIGSYKGNQAGQMGTGADVNQNKCLYFHVRRILCVHLVVFSLLYNSWSPSDWYNNALKD